MTIGTGMIASKRAIDNVVVQYPILQNLPFTALLPVLKRENIVGELMVENRANSLQVDKATYFKVGRSGTVQTVEYDGSTINYSLEEYALNQRLVEQDFLEYENKFLARVANGERLFHKLAVTSDLQRKTLLTSTLATATPTTKYDADGGNPLGHLTETVLPVNDMWLNTVVMSSKTFRYIRDHATTRAIFKNTEKISPEQLKDYLELKTLVISDAVYTDTMKGKTASYTSLVGDDIWCGYVGEVSPTKVMALGVSLMRNVGSDEMGLPTRVKTWNDPKSPGKDGAEYIQMEQSRGTLVIDSTLGKRVTGYLTT